MSICVAYLLAEKILQHKSVLEFSLILQLQVHMESKLNGKT